MSDLDVAVPDLGNFDEVSVVDVLVKAGDAVEIDTPLITLETEKATMDVPSTAAGVVKEVKVQRGGRVSKGDLVAIVLADGTSPQPSPAKAGEGVRPPEISHLPAPRGSPSPRSRGEGRGEGLHKWRFGHLGVHMITASGP